MKTPYDKTLQRLKARRAENPEYSLATRQLAAMSTDLNYAQQQINARIGRQGESISAQIGAMLAQNQSISQIYNQVYTSAEQAQAQRMQALEDQILGVEAQKEQYEFQKKQEDKARKQGFGRAILQGIGTVAGGIVGSIIPGAGTALGAQFGAALGQLVAGSGAIRGGSLDTGPADYESMVNSVGGMLTTASQWATTKYNQEVMNKVGQFLNGTSPYRKYSDLSKDERDIFDAYLQTGNYKAIWDFMGLPENERPKSRWMGY